MNFDEDRNVVAKRFFEQDYHDQGMVKWQGYYLSDHTEDVAKSEEEKISGLNRELVEQQSTETVGSLLKEAFDDQSIVTIQLSVKDTTGVTSTSVKGKISGYSERNTVVLNGTEIDIEDINSVTIYKF